MGNGGSFPRGKGTSQSSSLSGGHDRNAWKLPTAPHTKGHVKFKLAYSGNVLWQRENGYIIVREMNGRDQKRAVRKSIFSEA